MRFKKILGLTILIFCSTLLVGCAQYNDPFAEFPYATAPQEIAGYWQAAEDRFHYFGEGGSHYFSHSLEQIKDRVENNKAPEGEYWFEGDRHYHTATSCSLKGYDQPGVYEIKIINENEIKFVVREDECASRSQWLAGPEEERTEYSWTRVP